MTSLLFFSSKFLYASLPYFALVNLGLTENVEFPTVPQWQLNDWYFGFCLICQIFQYDNGRTLQAERLKLLRLSLLCYYYYTYWSRRNVCQWYECIGFVVFK